VPTEQQTVTLAPTKEDLSEEKGNENNTTISEMKQEGVKKQDEKKEEENKQVEEIKEVKKSDPAVIPAPKPMINRTATNDGTGGYFRTAFEQQARVMSVSKEQTATSGIFKTSSGWDDGKYYILIDRVVPGTIVKVTNPSNSKVIYAKVLEGMTGIRQNAGLDVRISNAAASILDVTETDKFVVKVSY
jgi:hypothetical protein